MNTLVSHSKFLRRMAWKTYDGKIIEEEISVAVEKVLAKHIPEGKKIRLCVGTDSQVKGSTIDMVTVIVFYFVGNGGFMFVNKQILRQKMAMRERILTEVGASVQTAYELRDAVQKFGVEIEIHADINQEPCHLSNQVFNDAMGYAKGMGYAFKAKPDAFASSVCADRLCH